MTTAPRSGTVAPGHALADGRARCDVCPHRCALREGERGRCFVRQARGGRVGLPSYGCVSGVAVDPVEKKPLYHFLPDTPILSLGTIGCNLSCRFCQNWTISQPKDERALAETLPPEGVVELARKTGCPSVAFTYNEPIVTYEYTLDAARACRDAGLRTVAVTSGFITPEARGPFFAALDAANVDLKSFSDDFYRRLCGARLPPVLDTLTYIRRETACWLELTTLLIPGENDGADELRALVGWVGENLGPDVPLHFSAFHPAHEFRDRPPTPPATLARAREIARAAGLHHVYTGNVRDPEGGQTLCASCGAVLIRRDGFDVVETRLRAGACPACRAPCAGVWQ